MDRINSLYSEWQSLQPISQEIQNTIDQKFMLEFNYNSNHLEGNTLTYGQTELLLMFGKVVENANMRDLEEMKASNVGLQMVKDAAQDKNQPLSEYFIRVLHKTLLREDYTVYRKLSYGTQTSYIVHAGQYKTRPNSVKTATGEMFEYASPEETPALMKDLIEWYNIEEQAGVLSPIELAALFHYRYIRIHPFEDGNGRISRLIVNYILSRHGYPMIIVRSEEKESYLNALNKADVIVGTIPCDGARATIEQIKPFVDYMKGCLERALSIRIRAGKGESIEEKDDMRKRLQLLENEAKSKRGGHKRKSAEDITRIANEFIIPFAERIGESMNLFTAFYNTCIVEVRQVRNLIGYERISFSEFKDIMQNNPLKYNNFYFAISLKNPTLLLKHDEEQEHQVYFKFNEEEYVVVVDAKEYSFHYGLTPSDKQVEKWYNEIIYRLYESLEQKVKNML